MARPVAARRGARMSGPTAEAQGLEQGLQPGLPVCEGSMSLWKAEGPTKQRHDAPEHEPYVCAQATRRPLSNDCLPMRCSFSCHRADTRVDRKLLTLWCLLPVQPRDPSSRSQLLRCLSGRYPSFGCVHVKGDIRHNKKQAPSITGTRKCWRKSSTRSGAT